MFASLILLCIVVNVLNLNISMRYYSQLYVMPFHESCTIIFNLLSGLVLLGEFDLYTKKQLTLIFIGCAITISGILLKLLSLEVQDNFSKVQEDNIKILQNSRSDEMIKSDGKIHQYNPGEDFGAQTANLCF